MDELKRAKLAERVEKAFPGDPVAQRQAWEFIESVFAAWGEAVSPAQRVAATTTTAGPMSETGPGFLEAFLAVLRDTEGRVASAVLVLLPHAPSLTTLARAEPGHAVEVEADVAKVAGLQGSITAEYGTDSLRLVARFTESSDPSILGGIVCLPDDVTVVERFERLEPTVAAAHFDLPLSDRPVGVVIAIFDQ